MRTKPANLFWRFVFKRLFNIGPHGVCNEVHDDLRSRRFSLNATILFS